MAQSSDLPEKARSHSVNSSTESTASKRVDEIFKCLSDSRRRTLLDYVSRNSGPVALEDVAQHLSNRENEKADDTADEIAISLAHVHLPKMADAGILRVGPETSTVEEGGHFDAARSLFEGV